MSEVVGRAGFDVRHAKPSKAGRANRRRLLEESSRHLDDDLTAKQARRNDNVDPSRTQGNWLLVNDGDGGLREGTVAEALDYGDARTAAVRRKVKDSSFTATTIVAHLPKSMCREKSWTNSKGETRTYWEALDEEEMLRYFEESISVLSTVIPGGMAGIHAVALNVDEYTPHIQILADTFADDDGKNAKPGDLRVAYSDAWSSSRRVLDENGRQKVGKTKLTEYQTMYRRHMVDAGFPVELDPDPVRSKSKLGKAEYIEVQNQKRASEVESRVSVKRLNAALDFSDRAKQREAEREAEHLELQAKLTKSVNDYAAIRTQYEAEMKAKEAKLDELIEKAEQTAADLGELMTGYPEALKEFEARRRAAVASIVDVRHEASQELEGPFLR